MKKLLLALLASISITGCAQAGVDVQIFTPPLFYAAPMYVQPRPVYVEPRRYYEPAPVVVVPQREYYREYDRREWRERQEWRHDHGRHHGWRD
jgi:hypothetical protein